MDVIEIVLLILLVVMCIALGALVLIQQGRGSDIGAAFGSGAANTLFGSSGATPFLVKFTAMLAIGFFAVTFALAFTAKEKSIKQNEYDFGNIPQTNEENLNDFLIPSDDEEEGSSDETDTPSTTEDDELPTPSESEDPGDILDQLLDEEDAEDATPMPEEETETGDTLPEL